MTTITNFLERHGPSRSSTLTQWLVDELKIKPEAARKRLSRLRAPLHRFPIHLLPKGESFIYHVDDRKTERFWTRFLDAMRASKSGFGATLDALNARSGMVLTAEFAVIGGTSGMGLRGQLMATSMAERLIKAGAIAQFAGSGHESFYGFNQPALGSPDRNGHQARQLTEAIVLNATRDWIRKLGIASYNSIAIRTEEARQPVCGYLFDLAGPSYLLPIRSGGKQPGFVVADVFSGTVLDEHEIQYFLRKVALVNAILKRSGSGVFAFLIADGFTGAAYTVGHAAGVSLATPKELFGQRAGNALQTLAQTLRNTAAFAASASPERIAKLIDDLSDIEGSAGNLRGVLFELLCAYLVRRDAQSINMGVKATDPTTGKVADIDILKYTNQLADCVAIECKGKEPGGTLAPEEAQDWIRRLPTFFSHIRACNREAAVSFELWTSGEIEADALAYLKQEQKNRTRTPISWRAGKDILSLAVKGKEKAITEALKQHFFHHPLAKIPPAL
jgi:hypothetical protein